MPPFTQLNLVKHENRAHIHIPCIFLIILDILYASFGVRMNLLWISKVLNNFCQFLNYSLNRKCIIASCWCQHDVGRGASQGGPTSQCLFVQLKRFNSSWFNLERLRPRSHMSVPLAGGARGLSTGLSANGGGCRRQHCSSPEYSRSALWARIWRTKGTVRELGEARVQLSWAGRLGCTRMSTATNLAATMDRWWSGSC